MSPDVAVLASFSELVKGNNGDGAAGLSKKHWELFHDIQLTERCLRRSGGEHDFGEVAGTPAGDAQKTDTVSVPHGIARAVDPPPPPEPARSTHLSSHETNAKTASRLRLEKKKKKKKRIESNGSNKERKKTVSNTDTIIN